MHTYWGCAYLYIHFLSEPKKAAKAATISVFKKIWCNRKLLKLWFVSNSLLMTVNMIVWLSNNLVSFLYLFSCVHNYMHQHTWKCTQAQGKHANSPQRGPSCTQDPHSVRQQCSPRYHCTTLFTWLLFFCTYFNSLHRKNTQSHFSSFRTSLFSADGWQNHRRTSKNHPQTNRQT